MKLFDLNAGGGEVVSLPDVHKGLLSNWSWNYDGSLLATSAKDKKLRIFGIVSFPSDIFLTIKITMTVAHDHSFSPSSSSFQILAQVAW